jgi:hypothetical protein
VATSDGSKRIEPADRTDATVQRARTPAEQRESAGGGSPDPEVLAGEIERTREELAETLDAIADKVSPKRVVERTKQDVSQTVKEGAAEASASVKEAAAEASAALSSGVASLKSSAQQAKETVQEKLAAQGMTTTPAPTAGALADAAEVPVADPALAVDPAVDPALAVDAAVDPAGADLPPLPAVGAVPSAPVRGSATTYGAPPAVPREVLAGAGAALAVLFLLLRRRKRR